MKRKLNLASLFLLAALPLGAISAEPAQAPAGSPPTRNAPAVKEEPAPLFDQLDVNRDNYLTKDEASRSTEVSARFKELDVDKDGRIALGEFKKGMQPKL